MGADGGRLEYHSPSTLPLLSSMPKVRIKTWLLSFSIYYSNLQALVSDQPTFEYFASKSKDCSFKTVGKSFFQSGFAMAVRKNSTFASIISNQLIQYEEYDITGKLRTRWFAGQCQQSQSDDEATFASLSIKDLAGLFLAICINILVCGLFSVLESHSKNICSRVRKYFVNNNCWSCVYWAQAAKKTKVIAEPGFTL